MRLSATSPGAPRARIVIASLACGAVLLAGAAPAKAKWVVKGAGFGHGIGMSQYGAFGAAKAGLGYKAILAQYYTATTVGASETKTIRVLLRPYQGRVRFKGATSACGRGLAKSKVYTATRARRGVVLRRGKRRLRACGRVLRASGGKLVLKGKGVYRGSLEIRASGVPGRLNAINAIDVETYLRGVIARESPSSWPLEALKAQAIAARSYALTTQVRGNGFDAYDDTRSQVYGGVKAETARTDQAVAATANEVVLHRGEIAQTFFFSTSGGHTENNEFSFLGGTPEPYLRGVPDPYERSAGSRYHRWTRKFSNRAIQAELGGLVKGRLKRIRVVRRGVSPRVVKAKLIGTRGITKTTGPRLRALLGLPDTWATFKTAKQIRKQRARRAAARARATFASF